MVAKGWGDLRKQAEDASKPLPEDWYDVQVEKAEAVTASTGKPMIKMVLNVMSGPQAGARKVWTQVVFSPDNGFALQMFFKNMAAFGLGEKFFETLPVEPETAMPLIAQALPGATARALIAPRSYQGVERDNVVELNPAPGGAQRTASVAPAPVGGGAAPSAPIPSGAPAPQVPAPQNAPAPAPQAGNPAVPPPPVF